MGITANGSLFPSRAPFPYETLERRKNPLGHGERAKKLGDRLGRACKCETGTASTAIVHSRETSSKRPYLLARARKCVPRTAVFIPEKNRRGTRWRPTDRRDAPFISESKRATSERGERETVRQ